MEYDVTSGISLTCTCLTSFLVLRTSFLRLSPCPSMQNLENFRISDAFCGQECRLLDAWCLTLSTKTFDGILSGNTTVALYQPENQDGEFSLKCFPRFWCEIVIMRTICHSVHIKYRSLRWGIRLIDFTYILSVLVESFTSGKEIESFRSTTEWFFVFLNPGQNHYRSLLFFKITMSPSKWVYRSHYAEILICRLLVK